MIHSVLDCWHLGCAYTLDITRNIMPVICILFCTNLGVFAEEIPTVGLLGQRVQALIFPVSPP